MKIFKNGFLTGIILQLAIGPVFFYLTNLTIQKTIYDGLAGVVAVTLVDYLFIVLAIWGIGKFLEKKNIKKLFGIVGSIVLTIFGLFMINNALSENSLINVASNSINIFSSFTSTFILTILSPLSIVFWTSIFVTKANEYNYSKKELILFGLSAGSATFIFMSISVIIVSVLKTNIPISIVHISNLIVGLLLIGYGTIRLLKSSHVTS